MTHNIDLIYQMFCRVVRLDKTNPNTKLYIKVTSNAEGMPEYTQQIMTAALMLGATENLTMFNGRNFRGLVMPRIEREEIDEDDVVVDGVVDIVDPDGNVVRRRQINDIMALDLIQMFTCDNENLINGNDRYAITTLGESLKKLNGHDFYDDKEGYFKLFRNEKIKTRKSWDRKYKELKMRNEINYHSHPWHQFDLTSIEFLRECYPDSYDFYDNKEGYFKLLREEKIMTSNNWIKIRPSLSKRDGLNYKSQAWFIFDMSAKEFFDECHQKIDFYKDKGGYFKLIKENKIYSASPWSSKSLEFSELFNVKYHSTPWVLFNQSSKEFFDECYPDKLETYKNKNGYFEVMRNEKITSGEIWKNRYKELSERDGVKYVSQPYTLFNQTHKEFFDECYPERKEFFDDKEGYFKVMREGEIEGAYTWFQKRNELSERDGFKYHSNPWTLFNQTTQEFFDECYPEREEFYNNKEGYFKLIKHENIITGTIWCEKYKELSERDGFKYRSNPWKHFKQNEKEFFDECYPERMPLDDKYKYFELMRDNKINGSTHWSRCYKDLSKKEGIKFYSKPWRRFRPKDDKNKTKNFFNEYREWLEDNLKPVREYRPAFLGEFSEMNKKWNTSNSNTNHKRLNADTTEWKEYHKLYTKLRQAWGSDIPYKVIGAELNKRPDWIVGDFGCGENLLSKEIKNKVHAFDHVAEVEGVTSCDVTDVPLHNNVLDVVVFSLSLMGTNYKEYFEEAYRVLKPMGLIMIAEPATRWQDREEELKGMLEEAGFKISGDIKHTERFIYIDGIKY